MLGSNNAGTEVFWSDSRQSLGFEEVDGVIHEEYHIVFCPHVAEQNRWYEEWATTPGNYRKLMIYYDLNGEVVSQLPMLTQ